MINRGEEDYIKAIYKLSDLGVKGHYLKTKALVAHLGHALPSVNEMIKKMVHNGFVEYKQYMGVKLTEKGNQEAEKLIKKHRLWELFLTDTLDLPPELVHEEAERLEHATSDLVLKALDGFLNHPKVCPHGKPIPQINLKQ